MDFDAIAFAWLRRRTAPLLVFAVSLLIWYHFLYQSAQFDVVSPSADPAKVPSADPAKVEILREEICPNGLDNCIRVYDVSQVWRHENVIGRIYRRYLVNNHEGSIYSWADVIPDEPDAWDSAQNSFRWKVRKDSLLVAYTKGLVGQMFVLGCARVVPSGRNRRTLMIGLGGASMPNFLLETDPSHEVVSVEVEPAVVSIARKWFGLVQSPCQKVVIKDGVDFVKDWTASDGRFNSIVVDACGIFAIPPRQTGPLLCPFFEAFVDPDQMANKIVRMLRPNGTFMVNVFVRSGINQNSTVVHTGRRFLLGLFRRHFGGRHSCFYIEVRHNPANKLLVCSLALSSGPMTWELINDRLRELPGWLQCQLRTEMSIEYEV